MRWGGQMSGASKSVIRLGHRSGLRFGAAEGEVCWIGLEERMGMGSSKSAVQRTRPGEKAVQGGLHSAIPFVTSCRIAPALQHSITPLLHSARDSLQPFPPFPSVWGGGQKPPRESGAAEK